jgi:hypothetical protein
MAKVLGLRQQRVQFFYDTDFRTIGNVSSGADLAASEKILFAGATPGDLSRTNMPSPGQLTSDQTFLCFAVRHEIQFYAAGVLGIGVTGAAGTEAFNAAVGLNSSDQLMQVALTSCTFSFKVSEKIEFEGPVTMTPAGGGVYGQKTKDKQDDTVFFSGSSILTNGVPDSGSIYVLPLPVAITKRQGIQMIEKKFNMGTVNVVTAINEFKGAKLLRAYIDGYNTRDVL